MFEETVSSQFPQTFLTNPSEQRIYLCTILILLISFLKGQVFYFEQILNFQLL